MSHSFVVTGRKQLLVSTQRRVGVQALSRDCADRGIAHDTKAMSLRLRGLVWFGFRGPFSFLGGLGVQGFCWGLGFRGSLLFGVQGSGLCRDYVALSLGLGAQRGFRM